jgi:hypothetical protein
MASREEEYSQREYMAQMVRRNILHGFSTLRWVGGIFFMASVPSDG